MSDLLREADEALRAERMEKFFKDHGMKIAAVIILLIAGVAGVSAYKAWNTHVKETQTATLLALFDAETFPENIPADMPPLRGGLKGMALLSAAGKSAANKDLPRALELYYKAYQDHDLPGELRDLAALSIAALDSESNKRNLLTPVAENINSPWRPYALLALAVHLVHAEQDYTGAIAHLSTLEGLANLPPALYERSRALSHLYRLEQNTQQNNAGTSDGHE